MLERTPGLVPVAKGNGYGFGLPRLAHCARDLGVPMLAVGVPHEVDLVREEFPGDILVLQPWRAFDATAVALARDPRVISTISRLEDLELLGNLGGDTKPRVMVEARTTMQRHGLLPEELEGITAWESHVEVTGWRIHLPLHSEETEAEARTLARAVAEISPAPIGLSHVPASTVAAIADELGSTGPDGTVHPYDVRLRMGTELWLGDPQAWQTTATVLDVHPVSRGAEVGYHQHRVPGDGWVVIVAGGTANGIGMEAPTAGASMRARAISVATGAMEAAGKALSPYTIDGRKRMFIEPPHMQSSMVFLPKGATPPAVGDNVPVQVRMTTVAFDETIEE